MKRELKLSSRQSLLLMGGNCRAYPDEKGIETLQFLGCASKYFLIAEPIPMKRELKLRLYRLL